MILGNKESELYWNQQFIKGDSDNMNNLITEDIQFLKELAYELKTQDNRCTANPYYYSILEKKRNYGKELLNPDGRIIVFRDGDFEEFDLIDDNLVDLREFLELEEGMEYYDEVYEFTNINDLAEYIIDYMDSGNWDIYDYEYYDHYSNAFLTEKSIKQHIISNGHHYDNPTTYLHHSFRNPELEILLAIVKKFGEDDEK